MLSDLQRLLGDRVRSTWSTEVSEWGERVELFRQYEEGQHRSKMTREMREMLRVSGTVTDQFNDNYCEMIVDSMSDRLVVSAIDADNDEATQWSAELLAWNRFDGLQMDVHGACVRDGDTFIMVSYDNERQMPVLTHEPAFDGHVGMIPVYNRMARQMVAAIKVWFEADDRRVNVYYADRVEKYIYEGADEGVGGGLLTLLEVAEWLNSMGDPMGVPVFHMKNKPKTRRVYGASEIANVVPLQDALNRTLVSMVLTGELTAFQVRIARGFEPPANLSPGMWVVIAPDGLERDQVADASVMEQGQIVPFISQADWIINQMGTISRTPLPALMGGDNQSGEALKEREKGLIAKVIKFAVKNGNVWEDVVAYAQLLAATFGNVLPPVAMRWYCRWMTPEVRNRTEIIDNAIKVREAVGEREFLRLIAGAYDYDPAKIEQILMEIAQQRAQSLAALAGNLPGFAGFEVG
jgi:hypothetical protein